MNKNSYDSIVVGGGIGGLTSAAFLAREGHKVLLIEKNKELGGLVNTFERDGFHFEAGARALEDAGIIFPMLADLGIQLEVVNSPVSVGVENEIISIDNIDNIKDYQKLLEKLYPESKTEIEKVIMIILKIMKHMEVLYGVENPAFKDLKRDTAFIFKKLLPWMPKFILTVGKINRMNMPVEGYLEELISDAALRDIISQHFFKNTPTFFALSYFSLYLDYFYPLGGVGQLSTAMQNKITELGGEIKAETEIVEVKSAQQVAKDAEGNEYQYENLIWAADLKTFYKLTDVESTADKIKSKFEETQSKVLASRGGDSVFSIYLQLDEPLESFKKIANGHFFYTPSPKGLGQTHRGELNSMISNWSEISKEQTLDWLDRFTELNTYEISIPGLKDPNLVPPGKTGMIISFLMEYDLFDNIEKDGWYKEFIEAIEVRAIDVLTRSVYPMLKEKIIKRFSFSPLNYSKRIGSSEGAITGWSFENPIPVVHKMQYSDKSVLTPIPNIFQAGQWAYSPAGVPMSILTGKLAADRVIKKKKKSGKR